MIEASSTDAAVLREDHGKLLSVSRGASSMIDAAVLREDLREDLLSVSRVELRRTVEDMSWRKMSSWRAQGALPMPPEMPHRRGVVPPSRGDESGESSSSTISCRRFVVVVASSTIQLAAAAFAPDGPMEAFRARTTPGRCSESSSRLL